MDKQTIVLVLGQTGVGKSTFIDGIANLYGKHAVTSSGLDSCTQEVTEVSISVDGMNVCLVDTPGFDDTNRQNSDILNVIYTWLTSKNISISLILYVQRITDIRVGGMSLKSISVIEKMCDKGMECLHFVTSMWDIAGENGDEREMELVNNYWKLALSKGSSFARLGSVSHNLSLLRRLLANSGQLTEFPNINDLRVSDNLEMEREQVHKNEISNITKAYEAKLSNIKSSHDTEVASLNSRIKLLESKLAVSTDSNATLKTAVSSLESELSTVAKSKAALEYNISSLRLDLANVTNSNTALQTTVHSLESRLFTATNSNATLEHNTSLLESKLRTVTKSEMDLEITVGLLKKDISGLSEQLSRSVINIEPGRKYTISNGNKWSYTGKIWGINNGWGGYFFVTNTNDDEAYWYLSNGDIKASETKNQIHFALDSRYGIVMHDKNSWESVGIKEA